MEVTWESPGPGQWAVDRSHMPAGCTTIAQEAMGPSAEKGFRRMMSELGAPLDTIDFRWVNGQMYTRLRPLVGGTKAARKPPPTPILKLLTRIHPELRRREKRAAAVMEHEPWQRVIADWHGGMKAGIEDGNLALQHVDLGAASDAEVIAHARECFDNCQRNVETHFWLHGYDMGPLGLYLFEASEMGVDPELLLSLLEGASPSTTGPLRDAIAIQRMVSAAGATPGTLDELRAVSPEVSAAVDRYLEKRSWVLFSRYDVDGITLGERPDLVLATIMNAVDASNPAAVEARIASVRQQLHGEQLSRFDHLLDEARSAMDLRDDNGPTTAEWPMGLLRRALLAVGDRLVAAGIADDRALGLELSRAELDAAGLQALPDGAELKRRRDERMHQKTLAAPQTIGPAEPAPPLEALPPAMRRNVEMINMTMKYMGMDGTAARGALQGAGIGTTKVTARARVATSPEEALDRLEPGEILVVAGTTPAYNLVLSMAGGVITSDGGPMSHAAVIARELGIPAVIGARGALTDIADGAMVEIDPVAGEVRLVSA